MPLVNPHPDSVAEVKPSQNELRIIDSSGDLRMTWDAEKPDEVASVKKAFDEKIKSGYKAYHVKKDGEKGSLMTVFDKDAEKIIMAPQLSGG
jgi:hypothetical protein